MSYLKVYRHTEDITKLLFSRCLQFKIVLDMSAYKVLCSIIWGCRENVKVAKENFLKFQEMLLKNFAVLASAQGDP